MASEIIITSTPRGLTGGSGFQPVKRTRGMTPAVSERLAGRSGYNHIYSAGDPRNPIVISHRVEHVGREYLNVLSVIRDAGTDHSGRSNRLAHLICVEASEAEGAKAGPAAVIKQLVGAKTFCNVWKENAHESGAFQIPKTTEQAPSFTAWNALRIDPGYAGVLADAAANNRNIVLLVPEKSDVLSLFIEAMRLVPPAMRWKTTFTTFGSGQEDFTWQAVVAGTPAARAIRQTPNLIDLTKNSSPEANPYVDFVQGKRACLPWKSASNYSHKQTQGLSTKVSSDGLTRQLPPLDHQRISDTNYRQQATFTKQSKVPTPKTPTASRQTTKNSKLWSLSITCGVVVTLMLVSLIPNLWTFMQGGAPNPETQALQPIVFAPPGNQSEYTNNSTINDPKDSDESAKKESALVNNFYDKTTIASKKPDQKEAEAQALTKEIIEGRKKLFRWIDEESIDFSIRPIDLGHIEPRFFIDRDIHKTVSLEVATPPFAKPVKSKAIQTGWQICVEDTPLLEIKLDDDKSHLWIEPTNQETTNGLDVTCLKYSALRFQTKFSDPETPELTRQIILGTPLLCNPKEIGEKPIHIDLPLSVKKLPPLLITTVLQHPRLGQPQTAFKWSLESTVDEASKKNHQIKMIVNKVQGKTANGFTLAITASNKQKNSLKDEKLEEAIDRIEKNQQKEYAELIALVCKTGYGDWTQDWHENKLDPLLRKPNTEGKDWWDLFKEHPNPKSTYSTVNDWVEGFEKFFKLKDKKTDDQLYDMWGKLKVRLTQCLSDMREVELTEWEKETKNKTSAPKKFKVHVTCKLSAKTAEGDEIQVPLIIPSHEKKLSETPTSEHTAERENENDTTI